MAVELDARPIGFRQEFLVLPGQNADKAGSKSSTWFTGQQTSQRLLPINGFQLVDSQVLVNHYVDYGLNDTLAIALQNLQIPKQVQNIDSFLKAERIINKRFHLGTDRYGRDILSRLIVGSRVSLTVGLVSVIFSLLIGFSLGATAAWYGGKNDDLVMWLVNVLWAIPTLLLVFAITLTIGKGFWEILVAIGLTSWVSAARLIRGQVFQIKEMDYIKAAQAMGYSTGHILRKHIWPNIAGPVMVIAAANFASAILIEAGLSFLGFGIQPPTPSWGLMIKEHYTFLVAGHPFPALIPGLAIVSLVLAFNLLGNALRDVLDVKGQKL